jgi:hypothetical protein
MNIERKACEKRLACQALNRVWLLRFMFSGTLRSSFQKIETNVQRSFPTQFEWPLFTPDLYGGHPHLNHVKNNMFDDDTLYPLYTYTGYPWTLHHCNHTAFEAKSIRMQ